MSEVILPGTYITVRDEGLISVGGVSTGNIGIVGTAEGGEKNKVYILSSFTEAKQIFEASPPLSTRQPRDESVTTPEIDEPTTKPTTTASTLLKSLELLFANGARTVYAVAIDPVTTDAAATEKEKTDTNGTQTTPYDTALALLANETVNLVLVAGEDVTAGDMVRSLKTHLTATATTHKERIGLVGCNGSIDVATITGAKSSLVDDTGRLIYVAPGAIVVKRDPATGDETTEKLSGAYTAAAVAGLLSSLPVQTSPTNKTINLSGLAVKFNQGQLETLVKANVLTIEQREGLRVVKGITTATNKAWSQITTRRIVDYAIYGVRAACNPYIGKLNNDRVRSAMKATIDGFLTRMVESEALLGYQLNVSATRAQEIAGQAIVEMTVRPTFSIDYILVTISLG